MVPSLSGHTAIVAVDVTAAEALARRLLGAGAGVVLVAGDSGEAGRLAAALDTGDRPVAVFCPERDLEDELDALVELAAELGRGGGR